MRQERFTALQAPAAKSPALVRSAEPAGGRTKEKTRRTNSGSSAPIPGSTT
ncbi:hypothetical protein [Schaalia hyovaginalis]|uniref:Uncharacterized protein n=1 Tax=Schaalia hyovaginalis TaxID=29316 RepID=A0A923IWP3_9ACTO|nr:hypothetical protein [Schaalia hyovaginalis]MBB6334312.1 hypothetical protein [Schaalia hyovaginalis]